MEKRKPMQLYFKLFCTYGIIVLLVAAALTGYFVTVSKRRLLEANQEAMERMNNSAVSYIEEAERTADYIYQDLYRSSSELEDLLAYFSLEPEAFQQYSLKHYMASEDSVYYGIHNFIAEAFEAHENLKKMELIGYEDLRMTECYPEQIFYPNKEGRQRLYELENQEEEEEGTFVYRKEIRNPETMEQEGCIIFSFEGLSRFERLQKANLYTKLVVLSEADTAVFDGSGEENWKTLETDRNYDMLKETAGDYKVYTFLDKKAASRLSVPALLTILAAGLLAVGFGMLGIDFYVKRLAKRVEAILEAMNQVTTGNLQVRVEVKRSKDELDMVASKFNDMCGKLELYIQKSYLAEIERKNAEMQALQSQINPHFLYNTLEAIRMKAICNGDREVGKMLYSMVVLFRSQLKEADIITLGQEFDYCKQYLELFEYRYAGTFISKVECKPELLHLPIPKFVLQPVIENYFVHGIERGRTDNYVHIWAERTETELILNVQDNGIGMSEADMEEKNRELRENQDTKGEGKSIGLGNVNRRIRAVYGDNYGISIHAAQPKGVLIKATMKIEEGENV